MVFDIAPSTVKSNLAALQRYLAVLHTLSFYFIFMIPKQWKELKKQKLGKETGSPNNGYLKRNSTGWLHSLSMKIKQIVSNINLSNNLAQQSIFL